mgnify:CR=1 FL=1
MKVKLLQSNDLQRLEVIVNKFLQEVKVESVQMVVRNDIYTIMITYYEKI